MCTWLWGVRTEHLTSSHWRYYPEAKVKGERESRDVEDDLILDILKGETVAKMIVYFHLHSNRQPSPPIIPVARNFAMQNKKGKPEK